MPKPAGLYCPGRHQSSGGPTFLDRSHPGAYCYLLLLNLWDRQTEPAFAVLKLIVFHQFLGVIPVT